MRFIFGVFFLVVLAAFCYVLDRPKFELFQFPTAFAASEGELCKDGWGQSALDACTQAIESGKYKERHLGDMYAHRASEHYANERYDEALSDANRAVELYPSNYFPRAEALTTRGLALMMTDRPIPAFNDLTAAILLDPSWISARIARAGLYERTRETSKAIQDYKAVLAIPAKRPGDQEFHKQATVRLKALESQERQGQ